MIHFSFYVPYHEPFNYHPKNTSVLKRKNKLSKLSHTRIHQELPVRVVAASCLEALLSREGDQEAGFLEDVGKGCCNKNLSGYFEKTIAGWWFQTFFIFTPTWERLPF